MSSKALLDYTHKNAVLWGIWGSEKKDGYKTAKL